MDSSDKSNVRPSSPFDDGPTARASHNAVVRWLFEQTRFLREHLGMMLLVPAQLWSPFIIRALEGGAPVSFEIMYATEAVSLVVFALCFCLSRCKRVESQDMGVHGVRAGEWVLAILFCLAPLGSYLHDGLIGHVAFVYIAVFGSAARMWFYALSAQVYGQMPLRSALMCVVWSFMLAIILRCILEALPFVFVLPVVSLLPFVYLFMLRRVRAVLAGAPSVGASVSRPASQLHALPLRGVLILVFESIFFGAIMGSYRFSAGIWQAHVGFNYLSLGIKIVMLLITLAVVWRKAPRLRANSLFQMALAFVVAAVTSVTLAFSVGLNFVFATLVIDLARYVTGFCLYLVALIYADRYRLQPCVSLAMCWVPYALAITLTYVIFNLIGYADAYASPLLLNLVLLIVAVVSMVLNALSSSEERLFSIDGILSQNVELFDLINERCAHVGEERGLTPREIEVMELICKGRSKRYIAEHFVISENTVRWHAKNLYAKLGINSRQELLDLIGMD